MTRNGDVADYSREVAAILLSNKKLIDKMELHGHIDADKVRYYILPEVVLGG